MPEFIFAWPLSNGRHFIATTKHAGNLREAVRKAVSSRGSALNWCTIYANHRYRLGELRIIWPGPRIYVEDRLLWRVQLHSSPELAHEDRWRLGCWTEPA